MQYRRPSLLARAIVEDMAEMAVAMLGPDFDPTHPVGSVGKLGHIVDRLREGGPSTARVELCGRRKQQLTRDDIDINARLVMLVMFPVKGRSVPLCCVTRYCSGVSLAMTSSVFR